MGIAVIGENDEEGVLQVISGLLSRFDNVDLGYILGSLFDKLVVAVVTSERLQPYDGMKFATKLERLIKRTIKRECNVNVRILQSSPSSFQHEVIRRGKLVFCRSHARRLIYEADILSKCSN
ncbi:MAG: hypothetical protein KIH01_03375 [Candidatus Freyarchaeota archaeon]|nr:hypothetical protein [Candidatus Jordarchaeia archaeon]